MQAENLTLGYASDEPVIRDLSLRIPAGRVTAVVGSNGSGKSTLLRGMSRLLKPRSGRVVLDGADIHRLPARELARRLGLLPQGPVTPDGITVAELVSRGRHPHRGMFAR
jgi:iron complex transport system ATP-binding protein